MSPSVRRSTNAADGGVAAESGAVNRPVSAAAAVVILKKSDAGRPQTAGGSVLCVERNFTTIPTPPYMDSEPWMKEKNVALLVPIQAWVGRIDIWCINSVRLVSR